jgi:hypothetical protein
VEQIVTIGAAFVQRLRTGVRKLAVLSSLAALGCGLAAVRGGKIGVDLFFVLSG